MAWIFVEGPDYAGGPIIHGVPLTAQQGKKYQEEEQLSNTSCCFCRHWEEMDGPMWGESHIECNLHYIDWSGFCHCNPPSFPPVALVKESGCDPLAGCWPLTRHDDTCGRFKKE